MNFISKLFNRTPKPPVEPERANLLGHGDFDLEVVGESHYQSNLETICGPRTTKGENRQVEATLILEDNNPHDKLAVRVEINGLAVGHLSRDVARSYREQLRRSGHPRAIGTCQAKIKGGWQRKNGDKGHYGVWLDIPTDD